MSARPPTLNRWRDFQAFDPARKENWPTVLPTNTEIARQAFWELVAPHFSTGALDALANALRARDPSITRGCHGRAEPPWKRQIGVDVVRNQGSLVFYEPCDLCCPIGYAIKHDLADTDDRQLPGGPVTAFDVYTAWGRIQVDAGTEEAQEAIGVFQRHVDDLDRPFEAMCDELVDWIEGFLLARSQTEGFPDGQ